MISPTLRLAASLTCVAALVAATAVTAHARQQTPAPQAAPTAPIVRPIPAPPDVAAPPADAVKSKSGLATKVITPGTGATHPNADDMVTVHYTGWTTDGKMFDSSVAREATMVFPLNRVIKGWTEGVQLMVPGDKMRFWIPAGLAYGQHARAGAPAGMLIFDIELIAIK